MKILVVGLGSIARRHIKNLRAIYPGHKISVLRQYSKSAHLGDITSLVDEVFYDEQEAVASNPEIVFVTNPAPFHVETALTFAGCGSHLFIEKPLSDSLEGIDDLCELVKTKKLSVMVGYVLRCSEGFKIVKKALDDGMIGNFQALRATVGRYLPQWRSGSDYRKNVSARKELGGGVLNELSHELDYARCMFGEIDKVSAMSAMVGGFEIDVEDIVEINMRFKNGAIGNIHLDMIDHAGNRSCRIIGSKGTIIWNLMPEQSVKFITEDTEHDLWNPGGANYNQMFSNELNEFFDCVKNNKPPLVDLYDGKKIVEMILAAKSSAEKGCVVKI